MTIWNKTNLIFPLTAMMFAVGCGDTETLPEGDEESASFGGSLAKADNSKYSICELREVVKFVNASTTDEALLLETILPLRSAQRASANIIKHRDGDTSTTADDNLFDDLDELDSVSFVGPKTLDRLVEQTSEACKITLDRPFMDSKTFEGSTGGGWTRDNVELEATFTMGNITGRLLREILLSENDNGRSNFARLRKVRDLEALTYDYDFDEMPWNGRSHRLRESMPYVLLTIESGRYDIDEDSGERELSLGTDIMDDIYFDNQDFDVTHLGMAVRGRARWDGPGNIRRLLIASKSQVTVDDEGIKRAAKVDVRRDGPTTNQIESIADDVMRGMVGWNGRDQAIAPLREVYNVLEEEGHLENIGGNEGVLLLDPIAHLRSTRSRFHWNEASFSSLRGLHSLGRSRITKWTTLADEMLAAGTVVDVAEVATLNELSALGNGILDKSVLVERVNIALEGAGFSDKFDDASLPDPTNFDLDSPEDVDKMKVVADTISDVYHDYDELLDDSDRILTDARDRDWDDAAEWFRAYAISTDIDLAVNRTMDAFVDEYEAMSDDSTLEDHIKAYNEFGEQLKADGDNDFEDFFTVDKDGWETLSKYIRLEQCKIHQRQVAAGGTMARSMWFDAARSFYVPSSSRQTFNFMIDTTDMTDMISAEEWATIPEAERDIDQMLPANKIFKTVLVNEVQIELGSETEYLDRIEALREIVEGGTGTEEDEKNLEGARFVFDEFRGAMTRIAEYKEDRFRDVLRDNGASRDIEWIPATHGKGRTALLTLADEL